MDIVIEWHDRLASTNTALRERLFRDAGIAGGLVVAAREQTDGRGRRDRKWHSAPGANLCFSLLVRTRAELMATPSLSMAAAMAVVDMLTASGIAAAPKWPNDVLVDDRKICGILSERIELPADQSAGIVVGIGLNVNMTAGEAGAIDRPATSMRIESGKESDPRRILADLCQPLKTRIAQWERGGFSGIREDWLRTAGPIGKPLTVHDGAVMKSGRLAGFGPYGELMLDTGGRIETIWSGDVSSTQGQPRFDSQGQSRYRDI